MEQLWCSGREAWGPRPCTEVSNLRYGGQLFSRILFTDCAVRVRRRPSGQSGIAKYRPTTLRHLSNRLHGSVRRAPWVEVREDWPHGRVLGVRELGSRPRAYSSLLVRLVQRRRRLPRDDQHQKRAVATLRHLEAGTGVRRDEPVRCGRLSELQPGRLNRRVVSIVPVRVIVLR